MYALECSATLTAPASALWRACSDIDRFPEWDPLGERCHLDGPFEVGATGYSKARRLPGGPFTIIAVQDGCSWTARGPLPGGELLIEYRLTPGGDGQVLARVRYQAHGPAAPAFRFALAPRLREEWPRVFVALEARARQLDAGR
ncbi:MAG TPA: SRPBCC family protein [Trebonia sp.]|jgi:uncharacterized protein YndB with AHSA1/START domain|nr:SRPBCC family protein [Trebonia sp.]